MSLTHEPGQGDGPVTPILIPWAWGPARQNKNSTCGLSTSTSDLFSSTNVLIGVIKFLILTDTGDGVVWEVKNVHIFSTS